MNTTQTRRPGCRTTLSETACNTLSTWFSKVGPSPSISGDAWLVMQSPDGAPVILSDEGAGYCTLYHIGPKYLSECGFDTTFAVDCSLRQVDVDRDRFVQYCNELINEHARREAMYDL